MFAALVPLVLILSQEATMPESAIHFSYSFATPHRVTLGRPERSERTLLDLQPGYLRMAWTYDDLTTMPLGAFRTPPTLWDLHITPQIDGQGCEESAWTRLDGCLPSVVNTYGSPRGNWTLTALGGETAALVRVELSNPTDTARRFVLRVDSMNWGENRAWCDPVRWPGDHLVAGWNERADRILCFGLGAEGWSLRADGMSEGPRAMTMVWELAPGESATGWLVRPYNDSLPGIEALRERDWSAEFEKGRKEWHDLLAIGDRFLIPDEGVHNGYLASMADMWIMREPVANGYIAGVPGTECYRAANSGEASLVAVALDQTGYPEDAERGYQVCLDMQGPDGDWADPEGWGHLFWACAGFKAYAIREHWLLTADDDYLARNYPRMLAAARVHERDRQRTRLPFEGERPLTWGLLPRGFGDCGLTDDGELYGVFLPHNIWAVYADRVALEAAEALGETRDIEELSAIYESGWRDLKIALERGAIEEPEGYRWIPGVPGKRSGSRWGALNVLGPCGLLEPNDPLVTGTLRQIESQMSPGGIPLNTGWLANGMWVAITLDNIAEAHLIRGEGDKPAEYLIASLEHGTPLYTWCEERGPEAGTTTCTGDRQHLWTPLSIVRGIRDIMVFEREGGLDLGLGAPRDWLASGQPLGVREAPTHFGPMSWEMRYDPSSGRITGLVRFPERRVPTSVTMHLRLPEGFAIESVEAAGEPIVSRDGTRIRWTHPEGEATFTATARAR